MTLAGVLSAACRVSHCIVTTVVCRESRDQAPACRSRRTGILLLLTCPSRDHLNIWYDTKT